MASSDWQSLDNVWYRKFGIWGMKWRPDPYRLDRHIVAAAPYGGPIAAVRNEKLLQPAQSSIAPQLQIFTAGGSLIAASQWNFCGLIEMSWAYEQAILVCVFRDGVVRTFSPFCERLHFFSIDERLKAEGGVLQAQVFSRGIVVVSAALQIYANLSFDGQRCVRLCDPGLSQPPLALCVLPPLPPEAPVFPSVDEIESPIPAGCGTDAITAPGPRDGGTTEPILMRVIVATESGQLLLVSVKQFCDLKIDDGPFVALSVSRTGKLLGCLSTTGVFKVFVSSNLTQPVEVANIECRKKPRQMVWCGDDCIALFMSLPTPSGEMQHVLFLGGPRNDWLPYEYGNSMCLVSEVDGVRIISPHKCEFLQRVPGCTEAFFSIGSCEPPAMLCYALERYELGDVAADESLRTIKQKLSSATMACIEAATYEWSSDQIQTLLRAAVFGRHFMDQTQSCKPFVRACRNLRICHAVREGPLEMPLTASQLEQMGIFNLVEQLARRRQHLLARRICDYVGLNASRVLSDWATEKIKHTLDLTDEQLCDVIVSKFKNCPGVSYSKVAHVAAKATRPHLATMLLELEPRSKSQVRMLLKLAAVNLATEKAVASGDPDLVYECITSILAQELRTADGQQDISLLREVLKEKQVAERLFANYCRKTGRWEQLQQYHERLGRLHDAGWISITTACMKADWEQRKTWLAFAAGFFGSDKGVTSEESHFSHQATLEQIELLNSQVKGKISLQ